MRKAGTSARRTMTPGRWSGSSSGCADSGATERRYEIDDGDHPHEAHYLKLDCSKARTGLGWQPRWGLEKALDTHR